MKRARASQRMRAQGNLLASTACSHLNGASLSITTSDLFHLYAHTHIHQLMAVHPRSRTCISAALAGLCSAGHLPYVRANSLAFALAARASRTLRSLPQSKRHKYHWAVEAT